MIYIVPDSNFLHISFGKCSDPVYHHFFLNQPFADLLKLRNSVTCTDRVQILLPEMVLRELMEQKLAQYREDVEAYHLLASRMGVAQEEFESVSSYRPRILEQAQDFLQKHSVELIPICDASYWEHIVDKAIKKEAPFEGVQGKADKGFKDTVIFFSIIQYARKHRGSYYLISKDGIFSGKVKAPSAYRLHQEFFDWSGSSFHVVADSDELRRRIGKREPAQVVEQLAYTMKEEKFRLNQEPAKIPVVIQRKIPVFAENHVVGAMINAEIDSHWHSFMKAWYEVSTERQPYEMDMIYDGSFFVQVTYNANNQVSVRFHEYQFTGGVHGGSTIYAYTYDLKEGKQLALTEVLQRDAKSTLQLVNQCVQRDIESNQAGKYFEEQANITDLENVVFYILDRDIHVVFNEYELGPYASGVIDLILCDC